MRLFDERVPWTEQQWWDAGRGDALDCVAGRYDGSDAAEEFLRSYIFGYTNGEAINWRTVPCPNKTHAEPFTWEECSIFFPGLLSERWRFLFYAIGWAFISVLFVALCVIIFIFAIHTYPG